MVLDHCASPNLFQGFLFDLEGCRPLSVVATSITSFGSANQLYLMQYLPVVSRGTMNPVLTFLIDLLYFCDLNYCKPARRNSL